MMKGEPHVIHWDTDEPVRFRVYGEPQPFPKKDVAIVNGRLIPVDKDYRTRKNPITGKKEKYDRGYKRRWMKHMRDEMARQMFELNLEPFPEKHPVALGLLFFRTRSKSCKLPFTSIKPDGDNYDYSFWNAVSATPAREEPLIKYLKGVLYWDDSQVVWRLYPSGWLWANEINSPGVLITVQDALVIQDEIMRVAASPEWSTGQLQREGGGD